MQSHRPCAYSASVKTLEGKSRSQSPSLYLRLATYSSSYCMGEYTLSRNDGQFRVCSAWLTFYPGLGADVSTSAQRSWRVRTLFIIERIERKQRSHSQISAPGAGSSHSRLGSAFSARTLHTNIRHRHAMHEAQLLRSEYTHARMAPSVYER